MGHGATGAFQTNDDLVVLAGHHGDRGHLFAKIPHRAGEEVALEFEDEHVRPSRGHCGLRLLAALAQLAEISLPHQADAQRVPQRVDLLVEGPDPQPRARLLPAGDGDQEDDGHRDGREDDETLGRESEYLVEDVHGTPL